MLLETTLLTLALALQQADTTPAVFDTPETQALVERTIAASGEIPADLLDYDADVQTSMFITLATDSIGGGDLPASVDEMVSRVRWQRRGFVHQEVRGHRTRLLIPLPYTMGTVMERPFVLPHLYGTELYTPIVGRTAPNPFGSRGPSLYRYSSLDTVRLRVQGELVTLVPVSVRPVAVPESDDLLVLGTFYIDAARGAVARARFGFVGRGGQLPRSLGEIGTFVELENGLWEGRYWLPYQQRRDVILESRVMGGAITARVVSRFLTYEFNTGWEPQGPRSQLSWNLTGGSSAFADWRSEVGEDAGQYSMDDFADLRLATATATRPAGAGPDLQIHYEKGSHLFRYNRVEGPFLGLGARLVPPDPSRTPWQLYGTGGWAFAENTARGEIGALWGEPVARRAPGGPDLGAGIGLYRRLYDIQPFRPTYDWDWIYTLPAAFFGSDERDYYDATGVELFGTVRSGRWDARLGGRFERHDSVSVNTTRYLFGEANEFGPLAGIEPGSQVALEGSGGYSLGPGAFGMGNSLVLRVNAESGLADFRYQRLWGLLSARYQLGPLTAAARVDGGHGWGGVPPQRLFRFGSLEGLRGYENNEFGGSTAMLARGRVLVGLPPRSSRPLARIDMFLVPPLRPALVLIGETGWTRVDDDLADELLRLGAAPTEGYRSSVGVGLSLFDDAVSIERLEPVGEGADEREGKWYVGLTYWY
ncbi:MAG TPA: hypothetical protein VFZ18_05455 [Longimicrobiaceae bacterium]